VLVLFAMSVYIFYFFLTVPTPVVNLRAVTNQVTGQPLTLECDVTAVRGITSSVDIIISSETFEDVDPIIVGNSAVYSTTFTIEELTSFDDGRQLLCIVLINSSSVEFDTLILDVLGKGMSTNISIRLYVHYVITL